MGSQTLKLVRRGHVVPEGLQAAVYAAQRVQDVMQPNYRLVAKEGQMTTFDGVTLVLDEIENFGDGGRVTQVCVPCRRHSTV